MEEIIADLTGDRPESQTAVDLPSPEREAFCDDIDAFTRSGTDGGGTERPHQERKIPDEILNRHGLNYAVNVAHFLEVQPEDDMATHEISATRQVTADVSEGKMVLFTRMPDGPEAEIIQDAWVEGGNAPTRPTKPLTVKVLRLIRQAIRDAINEE